MAKKTEIPAEPVTEFPVTLAEFLTELPVGRNAAAAAFGHAAQTLSGKRDRKTWQDIMDRFMNSPVGTTVIE
jgi:hypothetical protein